MIHYTLLPEREIRILKREYRTRLVVILLFFMSLSVVVGIISLVPAYVFSSFQEKEASANLNNIKNSDQKNEFESAIKELTSTNDLVKRLNGNKSPMVSSEVVGRIISNKSAGIKLNSIQFSGVSDSAKNATTSVTQIIIQGRSVDRETLVKFKNSLEADELFTKIELPVSDLTKSKDITFSVRLSIITSK